MAEISQNVNIEMLEKLPDGTYKKKHPETKASQVKLEDTEDNFVATEVEGAMSELFTNVSNGKDLVGGAITGVDDSVVIPTDPTFQDLASAIGGISTGKKWASGTVQSSTVVKSFLDWANRTQDERYVEVTYDFPFTPSIIVLTATDLTVINALVCIYVEGGTRSYQGRLSQVLYNSTFYVSGYEVNRNGFLLPAGSNFNYTWIAFE